MKPKVNHQSILIDRYLVHPTVSNLRATNSCCSFLTLDEDGIPADADGRVRIAEKIIKTAEKFGIKKKDIVIDALAMTISSEPEGAKVTLETLRRLRDEIGVNTVLGVSNISFGLPCRPIVNAAFYTMAMLNGSECRNYKSIIGRHDEIVVCIPCSYESG